jgi:hypothetical protein
MELLFGIYGCCFLAVGDILWAYFSIYFHKISSKYIIPSEISYTPFYIILPWLSILKSSNVSAPLRPSRTRCEPRSHPRPREKSWHRATAPHGDTWKSRAEGKKTDFPDGALEFAQYTV